MARWSGTRVREVDAGLEVEAGSTSTSADVAARRSPGHPDPSSLPPSLSPPLVSAYLPNADEHRSYRSSPAFGVDSSDKEANVEDREEEDEGDVARVGVVVVILCQRNESEVLFEQITLKYKIGRALKLGVFI